MRYLIVYGEIPHNLMLMLSDIATSSHSHLHARSATSSPQMLTQLLNRHSRSSGTQTSMATADGDDLEAGDSQVIDRGGMLEDGTGVVRHSSYETGSCE